MINYRIFKILEMIYTGVRRIIIKFLLKKHINESKQFCNKYYVLREKDMVCQVQGLSPFIVYNYIKIRKNNIGYYAIDNCTYYNLVFIIIFLRFKGIYS